MNDHTPEQEEEYHRLLALPFRMVITELVNVKRHWVCVGGKVESGMLRQDETILITTQNMSIQATVKPHLVPLVDFSTMQEFVACPGDHIGFTLKDVRKNQLAYGMVVTKQGEL